MCDHTKNTHCLLWGVWVRNHIYDFLRILFIVYHPQPTRYVCEYHPNYTIYARHSVFRSITYIAASTWWAHIHRAWIPIHTQTHTITHTHNKHLTNAALCGYATKRTAMTSLRSGFSWWRLHVGTTRTFHRSAHGDALDYHTHSCVSRWGTCDHNNDIVVHIHASGRKARRHKNFDATAP